MSSSEYTLLLKPSADLLQFIKTEIEEDPAKDDIPKGIIKLGKGEVEDFSSGEFAWVLKRSQLKGVSIRKLGLEIVLPTLEQVPRDPVLEARCRRLKAQQEDRQYKAMTKSVDATRFKFQEESIGSQLKEMNRQLIGVGQLILSVAAGFAFGFIGLELIIGEMEMGFRFLCGTLCALVIAVAELYFLIKHVDLSEYPLDAQTAQKTVINDPKGNERKKNQ
ncbi:uncharacterized protein LOC132202046 [Neocloeon triangulifer]|uniref:uncharacterized protein LOC132202046 n=1 Tax=Neocloeon triangulifer TaxID=2078957 RepID=UPI00286F9312|nr:uncharacterized protein LOC132202046 [Neocloeon triangulifer]XP_059484681.1 uncharacterized protein LOC132202046 [Neocloeon triangulifer]